MKWIHNHKTLPPEKTTVIFVYFRLTPDTIYAKHYFATTSFIRMNANYSFFLMCTQPLHFNQQNCKLISKKTCIATLLLLMICIAKVNSIISKAPVEWFAKTTINIQLRSCIQPSSKKEVIQ